MWALYGARRTPSAKRQRTLLDDEEMQRLTKFAHHRYADLLARGSSGSTSTISSGPWNSKAKAMAARIFTMASPVTAALGEACGDPFWSMAVDFVRGGHISPPRAHCQLHID
jgi:hypothetical protein